MGISQYGWAGPKGSTLNWVLVTSSAAHINCIDNYIIPIHKERFCCQQWCCYHIHGLDVSTNLCSYSSLSEKRDKHIICCRDIGWTIFNQSSIIKSHLSEVLLSFLAPPAAQASSFKSLMCYGSCSLQAETARAAAERILAKDSYNWDPGATGWNLWAWRVWWEPLMNSAAGKHFFCSRHFSACSYRPGFVSSLLPAGSDHEQTPCILSKWPILRHCTLPLPTNLTHSEGLMHFRCTCPWCH